MTDIPALTLIIGGAASGKSDHAEALLTATDRPLTYIATGQAYDAEMEEKIADHKARRGSNWRTIEAPLDLRPALSEVAKGDAVLVDCATLWLTNQMFSDNDLAQEETALLAALAACPAPVVVVTNEVGTGIVPENALARRFRNAQGALNRRLAAQADRVITVIAGLPLVLK
ncbi:bifunctional adenosylcobinamide kinase/adenosylcobinamide-phosphate guanylyltransferase [Aliiroseovarius subalbicans]|uniref:bifunctional adenosylcobinamide kinase/adenosylcobinamide-phosphate guanylyltransferase n=1 Tax=Aliiroseovarius subalbicans TaxID=2925840 RepID=UPI001F55BD2B|nr:bifunctional adenosylcobinamide kinase/adenosylcobinamide-phosphate guanylyltransferase [Aliiroseovarius subalbicans]MCI2399388.1 bifunctional adenosylcobinamide kinase/adenosylcobinamide-phosphate guanylyltransferase [Aliiroseovarius subalbicans]